MNENDLSALSSPWPGVTQDIKWEDDLVFSVSGKMFAVYCMRGPDKGRLSFKVDADRFLELTDQPGITPAHYMSRAFWVTLIDPEMLAHVDVENFVRHSYDLVRAKLTKRMQASLLEKEKAFSAAKKS
ncbi:MAG TPA: MmcQ/YjbR family DNA-binding protein [Rudaea sp.]|nr:MmcQ/YjbR family DNA-binding protein [Rudaea sp.]